MSMNNPNSQSSSSTRQGTIINLEGQADAIAISFYKMFGYPTGVGALIVKKSLLAKLKKPWFSGGTVEIVGIPHGVTESEVPYERFEV
jgi:selenocysteine lyase/cysteine desulfurase